MGLLYLFAINIVSFRKIVYGVKVCAVQCRAVTLCFLASFIVAGKDSITVHTGDLKTIHFLHTQKISGSQNKYKMFRYCFLMAYKTSGENRAVVW
jgi:hypothetical protein